MTNDGVDRILDGDHSVDRLVREVEVESASQLLADLHDRDRVDSQILEPAVGLDSVRRTSLHCGEDVGEFGAYFVGGRHTTSLC